MKANEIMVGDWVHYRVDLGKDGFYEKDIQINNIYGCDVNCKLEHEEIISGTPLYYCYPILLTPEILEKNGFVKELDSDGIHYRFILIQGCSQFSLLYARNVFQWLCPIDFKYVHELQHALKLCGIDKTIEL